MISIDYDKLEVKYLTGSYMYEKEYPTPLDILYDIIKTGKTNIQLKTVYGMYDISENDMQEKLNIIFNKGFIIYNNDNIKMLDSPWRI